MMDQSVGSVGKRPRGGAMGARLKPTRSVLTLVADVLAQSADPSGTLVPEHRKTGDCSSEITRTMF